MSGPQLRTDYGARGHRDGHAILKKFRIMPKLKTHKGAAKRFKKTGSGKIVRGHAFTRHILTSKTRTQKRRLGKSSVVSKADEPGLREMLPN
jgi:large subunit ribosomal protein L35